MRFPSILWFRLRIHRAAAWVVVFAGLAGGLPGDARAAPLEYQVKAGFLYNFAKFIEWPAPAFAKAQTPYSICVLGPDPFGEDLDVAVGEATLHGRRLMVRRLADAKNAGGCHILFVSKTDPRKLPALLQALGNVPTLTVGENDEFIRAGGCLRFFFQGDLIRFEINLEATERARLKVSAKLLNLAKVVGKPPGKN
jgi:uncharacterized protein DUF4154